MDLDLGLVAWTWSLDVARCMLLVGGGAFAGRSDQRAGLSMNPMNQHESIATARLMNLNQ